MRVEQSEKEKMLRRMGELEKSSAARGEGDILVDQWRQAERAVAENENCARMRGTDEAVRLGMVFFPVVGCVGAQ